MPVARTRKRECGTHQSAKSVKGVHRPSSGQRRRRAMEKRCSQAFAFKGRDGTLKFPLMLERGNARCCIDCRLARVAYQRASQFAKKYPGVKERIRSRSKAAGCQWAQKPPRR